MDWELGKGTWRTCALMAGVLAVAVAGPVSAKAAGDPTEVDWVSRIGGSQNDFAQTVEVDPAGNVYVSGETGSDDFPQQGGLGLKPGPDFSHLPDGVPHDPNIGVSQPFVAKYSPAGHLRYATVLPTTLEGPRGMAVDPEGAVYVAGWGLPRDQRYPQADAVVMKLSPSGSELEYTTILETDGYDFADAIAVDRNGRAYVGGHTSTAVDEGHEVDVAPDGAVLIAGTAGDSESFPGHGSLGGGIRPPRSSFASRIGA